MSERYIKIFSGNENLYTEGAPIIIRANALLKDTETGRIIAQLKFQNISGKTISYVKVSILQLDSVKNALGSAITFEYLDLSVHDKEEFGSKKPLHLNNLSTRSVNISISHVAFTDGTVWASDSTDWKSAEPTSEVAQMIAAESVYKEAVALIKTNTKENVQKGKELLESIASTKNVKTEVNLCKEKIEEFEKKAETDRLNKELKLKKTQDTVAKLKRHSKFIIAAVGVICVVIAFIIIRNNVIIPNERYNDAINLMEAGKYTEAISAFNELNGYKESLQKIKECNKAILEEKYNNAITLMEAGKYTEAISAFNELDGYKESHNKIEECNMAIVDLNYNNAIDLMNSGDIVAAYEALILLDGYKDSIKKANSIYEKYKSAKLKVANIGDYVFFGSYKNKDIEWLVLDVKDGKALVISKYALHSASNYEDNSWENCYLRTWLNNEFINSAFSQYEQAKIPTVTVHNYKTKYSQSDGNSTQDKIFLLSIDEVNKYFNSDSERQCMLGTSYCAWWLRYPCDTSTLLTDYAAFVDPTGLLWEGDDYVYFTGVWNFAVRPVMWIDLER